MRETSIRRTLEGNPPSKVVKETVIRCLSSMVGSNYGPRKTNSKVLFFFLREEGPGLGGGRW